MKFALDACTLIYLAKTNLLNLLKNLPHEYYIDDEVYREAITEGKEDGYSDAYILEHYINKQKFAEVIKVDISNEIDYFIGEGEASTFVLSQKKGAIAITSDRIAYKKMINHKALVVSTDMFFFNEFSKGHITKKELLNALDKLLKVGGTTPKRFAFILRKLGE